MKIHSAKQARPTKYPGGKTPAWEYQGKLYPRTGYPAGVETVSGEMLDMQTGQVKGKS